jgi:adenine phosphoribosyltransferase
MGKRLRESLAEARVLDRDGYDYVVHPLTDGIPALEPGLLEEVAREMAAAVDVEAADRIVTAEAMGLPAATAVALEAGLPLTVVRKRSYGLPDEVEVGQETGYSKGALYLNDLDDGDAVLVVDDVVSTGGTLDALLTALEDVCVDVVDVCVAVAKGDGRARVEEAHDAPVHVLEAIEVRDGDVVLQDDRDRPP